ncbi:hypothetical protein D3C79_532300 [compost metagenome]
MTQRDADNAPSMLAWGEWEKITLAMSGEMVKGPLPQVADDQRTEVELIRPVLIAGRRYAVWVERESAAIPMGPENKPSVYHALRVCFAFQQTDRSWSPANELMRLDGHDADGKFDSSAVIDANETGSTTTNPFLKSRKFRPGLMVMVNQLGGREDDPWLMVMLFDSQAVKLPIDKLGINGWKRDKEYFLIGKDLLLLDTKTLDAADSTAKPKEQKLVKNWVTLFRDPRTVQHPYVGARQGLKGESSSSDWKSLPDTNKSHSLIFTPQAKLNYNNRTIALAIKPKPEPSNGLTWALFQSKTIPLTDDKLGPIGTLKITELAYVGAIFKNSTAQETYYAHKTAIIITNKEVKTVTLAPDLGGTIELFNSDSDPYNKITLKTHKYNRINFSYRTPDRILDPTLDPTLDPRISLIIDYYANTQEDIRKTENLIPLEVDKTSPVPLTLETSVSLKPETLKNITGSLSRKQEDTLNQYRLKNLKTALTSITYADDLEQIKRSILRIRYTTIPDSTVQSDDDPLAPAGTRSSIHAAITAAQSAGRHADVSRYVESEKSAILQEVGPRMGEGLTQLLDALIRFRHFEPEACVRVLLSFDPEHTLIFTDELIVDSKSTIDFQLPISQKLGITHYEFELDLYCLGDKFSQTLNYELEDQDDDAVDSVHIRRNAEQALYLDLSEANKATFGNPMKVNHLRLNTLFGKHLVALASQSVKTVLSWPTQHLPEPRLEPGGEGSTVDFRGANGLYFWELFFHVPLLITWLLRHARTPKTLTRSVKKMKQLQRSPGRFNTWNQK